MSRKCMVTGARPGFGNRISHSHRRTKRRFGVNVHRHRYWVPSLGRHVRLTVSTRGMKTIERKGIDVVAADLLARGVKL